MRITTPLAALALALGLAAPAFAQSGATQTPPAPNAGNSAPTPPNSLPAGAATANQGSAGANPTMGTQTGTAGMPHPAYPSGSTGNNPSGAASQTVPQPATR